MKHFFRVFKIVALSLIALQVISFMLLFSFRNSNFYKPGYAFRNSTNQYDFVILGSSRGLTSIDTKYLSQRIGQKGFNFSLDDSHIGTHELMLEHLIWNKIKLDTLFLVYENSSEVVKKISSNDYRFLPFVHTAHTYGYLRVMKETELLRASQYFPFAGLGYYNIELLFPSLLSFLKPNYRYHYDEYGDYSYPNRGSRLGEAGDKTAELNFNNVQLNRMYDRCSQEGIQLIILISPSFKTTFTYVGDYKKFNVIDLSQSVTDSTYFYDQLHLNSRGKGKFTEIVSTHLLMNKENNR
jgi:hypothetical protein